MNILIVYAHPVEKSLNGSLKNYAIEILKKNGHQVKVSDLYDMNFKAVADKGDFTELSNTEHFNYLAEQAYALRNNTFSEDILKEQSKLIWADLIIFQFPIWWTESPAILKGWFDRVFSVHFAYGPGVYDKGNLKGRKAMLSITHGGNSLNNYGEYGLKGQIYERLFNIQHEKLYFCGMDVITPFIFPSRADDETRQSYFEQFKIKLENIENEPLFPFHSLSHYEGGQLKPEYRDKYVFVHNDISYLPSPK